MKRHLLINDTLESFDYEYSGDGSLHITMGEKTYTFHPNTYQEHPSRHYFHFQDQSVVGWGEQEYLSIQDYDLRVRDPKNIKRKLGEASSGGGLVSPMPGKILQIFVKVGDEVKAGDPLMVMEAMKMEHTIKASASGTVARLDLKEGDLVDGGVSLCSLYEEE